MRGYAGVGGVTSGVCDCVCVCVCVNVSVLFCVPVCMSALLKNDFDINAKLDTPIVHGSSWPC